MAYRIHFKGLGIAAVFAAAVLSVSCDKLADAADAARTSIQKHLKSRNVYDRANVPTDPPPTTISGYYDVIGGAFRYITNESRDDRAEMAEIKAGDIVQFYFEAYIFSSNYENTYPYFTNLRDRIIAISNNNPEFDVSNWSTDPLIIEVGYDSQILNSIQNTLPNCRVGDEVTIFLPPDVAYGSDQIGVVPGKSALVFKLTGINIIE